MIRKNPPITLITGATKGIGKAIATSLLNKGHHVINLSKSGEKPTEFLKKKFVSYAVDISNIPETLATVHGLLPLYSIQNVILNAGITDDAFFHKMKPDQWTSVINTNVLSAYGILHPIINQMRDREAAETKNIVFVSSVNAHRPVMGQTNYAASKAALLALNRCLAIENASKNIRCNVVSPGYIETEMTAKMRDDVKKRIESDIPLKRFGSVDEIASIVTMLVTEPHYFQGANIDVNGGLFIR